jgi:hypothetical protein
VEGIVRHLGLLSHHFDHHLHLVNGGSASGLGLHLGLLGLHLLHLALGGLFEFLDVLHGLELVDLGLSLGSVGIGFLELTLLGHHDELLSLGVLHQLAVSHLEVLLGDLENLNDLHEEFLRSLFFSHEHLTDDVLVSILVLGKSGLSALLDLELARFLILLLHSSDDELKELEEILSIDHISILLDDIKLLCLQKFNDIAIIEFISSFFGGLVSKGLPDKGGGKESSSSSEDPPLSVIFTCFLHSTI